MKREKEVIIASVSRKTVDFLQSVNKYNGKSFGETIDRLMFVSKETEPKSAASEIFDYLKTAMYNQRRNNERKTILFVMALCLNDVVTRDRYTVEKVISEMENIYEELKNQ